MLKNTKTEKDVLFASINSSYKFSNIFLLTLKINLHNTTLLKHYNSIKNVYHKINPQIGNLNYFNESCQFKIRQEHSVIHLPAI